MSSLTKAPNSLGVLPIGSEPRSAMRLLISASFMAVTKSAWSFSMTGYGVPAGREHAVPAEDLVTQQPGFRDGRKLGHEDRALRGGDCEPADSDTKRFERYSLQDKPKAWAQGRNP